MRGMLGWFVAVLTLAAGFFVGMWAVRRFGGGGKMG